MAGGYSLGPSIDLVARGRDVAPKASLVSQTSAGQVRDVSLPDDTGGSPRIHAGGGAL
jgi:hypothetical protein